MRKKSKLEKWMERYLKVPNLGVVESTRSRYYTINHRVIRISDHVAINSDGDVSIIMDSHDSTHFIIHAVKTGEISVLTYDEVKQLLRAIKLLPAVLYIANTKEECVPKVDLKEFDDKETIMKQAVYNSAIQNLVCGVPLHKLKTGTQDIIKRSVKKLKKKYS